MKTVWRYQVCVGGAQETDLPPDAKIVHVDSRNIGLVEFWAEVDSDLEGRWQDRPRRFVVVGTGHERPEHGVHVGSCIPPGGAFVWHLYELDPEKFHGTTLKEEDDVSERVPD